MILGAAPVTLRRYAAGTRADETGRFTAGTLTTSTIRASVQPLTEKELKTLPEGERSWDQKKILTTSEIRTGDHHLVSQADRIVVDSIVYEVRQVDRWRAVLPHYEGRIVRLDEVAS